MNVKLDILIIVLPIAQNVNTNAIHARLYPIIVLNAKVNSEVITLLTVLASKDFTIINSTKTVPYAIIIAILV